MFSFTSTLRGFGESPTPLLKYNTISGHGFNDFDKLIIIHQFFVHQLLTNSNLLQHFWWIHFLMNSWNSDITKKFQANVKSAFDFQRNLETSERLVTVITKNTKNTNQPKTMTHLSYSIEDITMLNIGWFCLIGINNYNNYTFRLSIEQKNYT